jgi:hypothetical protein
VAVRSDELAPVGHALVPSGEPNEEPGRPDALTRAAIVGIAFALGWLALRPHVPHGSAEASRETLTINLGQVGGRLLREGALPVRCVNLRP